MLYKILNNQVDITPDQILTRSSEKTRSNHRQKFRQIPVRTISFQSSFFPLTIPAWNSLPAAAAEAPSLASLKGELNKIFM